MQVCFALLCFEALDLLLSLLTLSGQVGQIRREWPEQTSILCRSITEISISLVLVLAFFAFAFGFLFRALVPAA